MIQIDIKLPRHCAQCPLMVVHRGEDFLPTYLCKIGWKELDHEYICKKRAEFCPMNEQEAVEPITEHHLFTCPACKSTMRRGQKYCAECGKHILWEGWMCEE